MMLKTMTMPHTTVFIAHNKLQGLVGKQKIKYFTVVVSMYLVARDLTSVKLPYYFQHAWSSSISGKLMVSLSQSCAM